MDINYLNQKNSKIQFSWVHKYVHSYHVEGLHDRLSKYKSELTKEFLEKYKELAVLGINNVTTRIKEFEDEFAPLLYHIVNKYYLVDEAYNHISFGTYIQDKDRQMNYFHHHWEQTTMSSTMYIDPLKSDEGGGLQFRIGEEIINVLPEKDYIYFFPSWLQHRPAPQTVKSPRICMNWGYNCNLRPIHKISGDRW